MSVATVDGEDRIVNAVKQTGEVIFNGKGRLERILIPATYGASSPVQVYVSVTVVRTSRVLLSTFDPNKDARRIAASGYFMFTGSRMIIDCGVPVFDDETVIMRIQNENGDTTAGSTFRGDFDGALFDYRPASNPMLSSVPTWQGLVSDNDFVAAGGMEDFDVVSPADEEHEVYDWLSQDANRTVVHQYITLGAGGPASIITLGSPPAVSNPFRETQNYGAVVLAGIGGTFRSRLTTTVALDDVDVRIRGRYRWWGGQ